MASAVLTGTVDFSTMILGDLSSLVESRAPVNERRAVTTGLGPPRAVFRRRAERTGDAEASARVQGAREWRWVCAARRPSGGAPTLLAKGGRVNWGRSAVSLERPAPFRGVAHPVGEIGSLAGADARGLGRGVDRDEDDRALLDRRVDVGREEEVAAPRLLDNLLQPGLVDRQVVRVPRGDATLVEVAHGHLDVGALHRDHRHRGAAHIPGTQAADLGRVGVLENHGCFGAASKATSTSR
eukprot:6006092-Prymnesium_polylepis.2